MPTLPPKQQPLDPEIISRAPIEPDKTSLDISDSSYLMELIGELSAQVEDLGAENERLNGQKTFEDVRALMAEPYANKVYWFLVFYCSFVGLVLILDGFPKLGFHISDVVLGVISGSTAVAAIGLVGFVVSGLFGSARAAKD